MLNMTGLSLQPDPASRQWTLGSYKEFTDQAGLRALFSEFLGTFMLVLFATGLTIFIVFFLILFF